jgi:transketolase
MKMRFESCGFDVIQIDGHNFDEIRAALQKAQSATRPTLIDCKTTIGFGSPAKAGTEKCHGSPLGAEEVKKTREALGWNHEPFFIPENLRNEWLKAGTRSKSSNSIPPVERSRNQGTFDSLPSVERSRNQETFDSIPPVERSRNQGTFDFPKSKQATRKSSQQVLEFLTGNLPNLVGGSADLTGSVLTKTSHTKPINKDDFSGRYIHYGVREHAMGAIMNGIALHSNFIPYGGTFLVFADYMKPAIRLAALMQQQLIYIFTHDSIGLGEDGPTHQAIEHLAMLRGIPNLNVFRPADSEETWQCFEMALAAKKTPSAMILTRQDLPFLVKEKSREGKSREGKSHEGENLANRGGYALNNVANPEVVIIATGSEVSIAVEAKEKLQAKGVSARVVSMPCFEIFEEQEEAYKNEVLGAKNILRVGVEAAISQGWEKYLGFDGIFVGMKSFGASGKAEDLYKHFGITSDAICEQVVKKLRG